MSGRDKERLIVEYMRENDGIIPNEGELVDYAMTKHNLKIFQLSNGMYYVRIKTDNGRKRIGAMTKEGLLKKVDEYFNTKKKSVEDIFREAVERKYNDMEIQDSAKARYERAFQRFFHDDNNETKRVPAKKKKAGGLRGRSPAPAETRSKRFSSVLSPQAGPLPTCFPPVRGPCKSFFYFKKKKPAAPYFPPYRSIIGAGVLDFRVRNGNGYIHPTMATGI